MRRALRTVGILLGDAANIVVEMMLAFVILVAVGVVIFGVSFLVGSLADLVAPEFRDATLLGSSPIDTSVMGLTVIAGIALTACLYAVARGFARAVAIAWYRAGRGDRRTIYPRG